MVRDSKESVFKGLPQEVTAKYLHHKTAEILSHKTIESFLEDKKINRSKFERALKNILKFSPFVYGKQNLTILHREAENKAAIAQVEKFKKAYGAMYPAIVEGLTIKMFDAIGDNWGSANAHIQNIKRKNRFANLTATLDKLTEEIYLIQGYPFNFVQGANAHTQQASFIATSLNHFLRSQKKGVRTERIIALILLLLCDEPLSDHYEKIDKINNTTRHVRILLKNPKKRNKKLKK
ncbi:hypothetical protein Dip518_000628 [Parelusimicrobium proximum]|uniref:hypothetical protein n=1 Tax=Parelusimicrobium proximum TaxID=3228953 RepID=UPI003D16F12F